MIVYYDDSSAGAGKTFRAIERIVRRNGRFLFITERVESLWELEGRIRFAAERMGAAPIVRQIHSDTENRGNCVALEIAGLPDLYRQTNHIIVLAIGENVVQIAVEPPAMGLTSGPAERRPKAAWDDIISSSKDGVMIAMSEQQPMLSIRYPASTNSQRSQICADNLPPFLAGPQKVTRKAGQEKVEINDLGESPTTDRIDMRHQYTSYI